MRRRCGTRRGRQGRAAIAGGAVAVLLLMVVAAAARGTAARGTAARSAAALSGLRDALDLGEGPVYAVGYLHDELALRPEAWLGRTVRVYAVARQVSVRYCPYPEPACVGAVPVLADAGATHAASLPLVWGMSNPLRAWLRRLPLITHLVPPQVPRWGRPATYRVALRLLPGPRCHGCYAAVLFDASPVAGL